MQHIVITMTGKPIDPAVNNIHKNTSNPLTIFVNKFFTQTCLIILKKNINKKLLIII